MTRRMTALRIGDTVLLHYENVYFQVTILGKFCNWWN